MPIRRCFKYLVLCGCFALQVNPAFSQTPAAQKLRIVGGLAALNQYTRNEEPFWTKELSRLSAGKYSAEIVPFDQAGVPSGDMLRLIQLGVVPFGTALLSNVAAQHPEFGAPDLAGLNPDMASLRRHLAVFRPYLEREMRERQGVEVLAVYVYPAQVIFCRKPMRGLADLKGQRVRVSSATQSDFVGALGGTPVLTSFGQIMASMASGSLDCAITAAMSGNKLGLQTTTSQLHAMPVTWGLAVFGANVAAWSVLDPDLRTLLRRELPKLESTIWLESERETLEGFACNTGAPNCTTGKKGTMVRVPESPADEQLRKVILNTTVLPRWLQRCGAKCSELWNQTIGQLQGSITPTVPGSLNASPK